MVGNINEFNVQLKTGTSFVKIRPFFTFDSKHILLAAGCNIKVISVASGECVRVLKGHPSSVVGLQANPQNHTQLVSCSRDGTIITWDILDGIALKKYKLKDEVFSFFAPRKNGPVYVLQFKKEENDYHVRRVKLTTTSSNCAAKFVMKNVLPDEHAVAFGVQGELIASINNRELKLFDLKSGAIKSHWTQGILVCVTCHPSDYVIATGDDTGRIVVWNNIFNKDNVCRSIYHWHTLAVGDLCFSREGCYLYSGGGECVLVKWNLQRETKEFLPRMGMPICHLLNASDNAYTAVSHMDNGVSIVNPQQQVVQYIQGLSQGHPWSTPGQLLVPTGLLYDPRSRALVLNGRPGHLQFYSLAYDKQLFSLDVVGENFLTQERNKTIYNTQVEKAALDSNGTWMATVQRFENGVCSPDIALKVWKYDETIQTYSLNTTVLLPHYKKVNCMKFRPPIKNENPLFVTTSEENKFKTWTLKPSTEGATNYESWICESLGHFREYCPLEASFNSAGSSLAVAFQTSLTLWDPSPLTLTATFTHPLQSQSIEQVFFGNGDCVHLIVTRCSERLCVWDSVDKTPKWTAELTTTQLTADEYSEYMAAFGKDHTLYVFRPSSAEPCFIKPEISSSDVITAAFIPHSESYPDHCAIWQKHSQLYFLNSQQELLTVVNQQNENDNEMMTSEVDDYLKEDRILHGTSFAVLMAQTKTSGVKTPASSQLYTTKGLVGAKEVKELLEIPSHVMPPLRSLCASFMKSLLIPKTVD